SGKARALCPGLLGEGRGSITLWVMVTVPPPPRVIRPTHPIPWPIKALGRLILIAVFAAEAVLVVGLAHEGVLRGLGYETQAKLISVHERKDEDGAYRYSARYVIERPGRGARTVESSISWGAFHRLSKPFIDAQGRPVDIVFPTTGPTAAEVRAAGELGSKGPQTLLVRGYDVGSFSYSRAVEHEWGFMFWLIPALFAPVVGLLCWALYLGMVVRPRRRRWLYTDGTAVPGTVTGGRVARVKGGTLYYVWYEFAPADGSGRRESKQMVAGPEEYAAALSGRPVTVLYDPGRPKRSVVYEYGGYAWV
ncbi:MAG: DUF3592 domain-containing protein, partial [Phycisphaerae bacterium]